MLVAGDTAETILQEYPELERVDVQVCLRFGTSFGGGRAWAWPASGSRGVVRFLSTSARLGRRCRSTGMRYGREPWLW